MGHCTSKDQKEGKRLNRRIDEQIKKDQSMSLRIIKLLLLEQILRRQPAALSVAFSGNRVCAACCSFIPLLPKLNLVSLSRTPSTGNPPPGIDPLWPLPLGTDNYPVPESFSGRKTAFKRPTRYCGKTTH
ncbi:hypothetical protein Aduo_014097 [Ancylostoma duodenale]